MFYKFSIEVVTWWLGTRLKILKETSEAINRISTDNTLIKNDEDNQWSTKH